MFFRLMASMLRLTAKTLRGTYGPVRGALGGNLFRSKGKNRLLSALSFRLSSNKYNLIQPLFRVSFRQSQRYRRMFGVKKGFFTSRNTIVGDNVFNRSAKNSMTISEGWDFKDTNFML